MVNENRSTNSNNPEGSDNPILAALTSREAWRNKTFEDAFDELRDKLRAFIDSGDLEEHRTEDVLARIETGIEQKQARRFVLLVGKNFTVVHPKPLAARRWGFRLRGRPWMWPWSQILSSSKSHREDEEPLRYGYPNWQFHLLFFSGYFLPVPILIALQAPATMFFGVIAMGYFWSMPLLTFFHRRKRQMLATTQTRRLEELSELIAILEMQGYKTKVILEQIEKAQDMRIEVWVRYTRQVYLNARDD
jgi:hypothetical protein